jgi:hypothetical protein
MKTFLGVLFVLAIAFGAMCFETWLIMLLWNWLMPLIFTDIVQFTFWQMFGICLLVDLLFGGIKVGFGRG